jgi:hypothetical protein
MDGDLPDELPQVLSHFVQAEPKAARIVARLKHVAASGRWDEQPPPGHVMDQIAAAIRDMHAAYRQGEYAAALGYLHVWAHLLGADDVAPE